VTPDGSAAQWPYARRIIEAYLRVPDTPSRPRQHDFQLAVELHRRGVPETTVEAAFLVATARRRGRPPGAPPLGPIRSLHYFLPVIEELLHHPPSADYLSYLRETMSTLMGSDPVGGGPKNDAFT
jgi:hypothetical protein